MPATVIRTSRLLSMLLGYVAKPFRRDKFEVTPESVAYLTALVAVSEEVRSRCHVKHAIPRWTTDMSVIENGEMALFGNQNVKGLVFSNIYCKWDTHTFVFIAGTRHAAIKATKILGYAQSISFTVCPPP